MKGLEKYDIRYDQAILSWDEALPLGNGKIGALIYGDGPICIALDRVDLWDKRVNPTTLEKGFTYANMVRLAQSERETDWKEYQRLFDDIYGDTPYPTKLTACRLELDFGRKTRDIHSHISLENAVAKVEAKGENSFRLESFISATESVGVIRLYGAYQYNFHTPKYMTEAGADPKRRLNYPPAIISESGTFTVYRQDTLTDFSYAVILLEKRRQGYTELFYTVATTDDSKDFISYGKELLRKALQKGYDLLKAEHMAWWKKYWLKSKLKIGDFLLEKTYYRSWYLFASCSRKGSYPMPLQGVWTADNDELPPWKGDYHHDTNTQLSYQAYLKANRLEEGKVFIDYLWGLKSAFEKFAKEFYGVDGLLLPSCSTIDGKALGGWPHYSLSPTMTIWTAQSFDEYYLYTGDEAFLRERAYPFLKGVGKAIYGLLEEKDGKLYLPLSTSPEINDNRKEAYLQPNSNFDQALLLYLFKTLQGYEKRLGGNGTEYTEILSKLDDIAVDNGMVMLDKTQHLTKTHRHFSHLMCLYPLHLINYDTPEHKKIYNNSIFELEYLGTGMWVGFSFAMSAQIYAMAENGNAAYERLYQFANGFVAENGFHLNGDFKKNGYTTFHYRPFTLESLFGFCDALQEMLLQEHQGYIHLFPAVPEDWKKRKIAFQDLRSYGGVLVSAQMFGGQLQKIILKTSTEKDVCVKNTFGCDRILLQTGKNAKYYYSEDGFFYLKNVKGKATLLPIR